MQRHESVSPLPSLSAMDNRCNIVSFFKERDASLTRDFFPDLILYLMPRLRSIERSKYQSSVSDSDLVDIDDQRILVDQFRQKLNPGKPHKILLKLTQLFIFLIGLVLVMVPHYRHRSNGLMSTFAIFVLWSLVGQLYSVCNMNDQMTTTIKDMYKSLTLSRVQKLNYIYILIFGFKSWLWWQGTLDWLYIIPALLGYLITDQEKSQRQLLNDISRLETMKYNFKAA